MYAPRDFLMSYRDIVEQAAPDGDGIQLLTVQGIATAHRLFLLDDATGWPTILIYVVTPEGGPFGALSEWKNTQRLVKRWDLPRMSMENDMEAAKIQLAAMEYVVYAAHLELLAELGLDPE